MTVGSVRRVDIHTPSSATGPAPLAEIPGFARAAGAPPFSLGRDLLGCEKGKAAARVSQAGTTCQHGFPPHQYTSFHLAASFRTVVMLRTVMGPTIFSSFAPVNVLPLNPPFASQ